MPNKLLLGTTGLILTRNFWESTELLPGAPRIEGSGVFSTNFSPSLTEGCSWGIHSLAPWPVLRMETCPEWEDGVYVGVTTSPIKHMPRFLYLSQSCLIFNIFPVFFLFFSFRSFYWHILNLWDSFPAIANLDNGFIKCILHLCKVFNL